MLIFALTVLSVAGIALCGVWYNYHWAQREKALQHKLDLLIAHLKASL